ncbi:hypothetical protein [Sphingomonas sp. ID1715]|uniref:hypothetical protein n=1 Tax=Sphingomonas sp. ID1715 TaxID=1656898 RepID=UPI0014880DD1|nr:hypothetical protein [Sphingomonas sp. ID1715]
MRRRSLFSLDRETWDTFAIRSGAAYTASYRWLVSRWLKGIGRKRVRLLEISLRRPQGDEKIAQCALESGAGEHSFVDGLQILPEYQQLWPEIMAAVLADVGAGRFRYGGTWNIEPPRHEEAAKIRGVTVGDARDFFIQLVELSRWPSWDRYWAKVSDSVRYESKYAPERVPGLRLVKYAGMKMLAALPSFASLQGSSYSRKGINFSQGRELARYAYYGLICADMKELILAHADAGVLAGFFGAQFGRDLFYIHGGQRAGNGGANWFLLKEMTRLAYDRDPNSRFVMGNFDPKVHDESAGGGLLRARKALRTSDVPTSMFTFTYAPAAR